MSAAAAAAILSTGGLAGAASGGSVCPAAAIDIGTYCLSQDLQTVNGADTADYFTATRACASQGGFLPSADELIGAANQVKLAGRLDDSSGDATIDQDPADSLSDWREMSSTPVTTQSGSDASGTEGVSQQATGNPATGEPNPSPQPADTAPASLQYGTVIDNGGHGVFTGSEPVSIPERFRCAFNAESPANVPTTMSSTPADPTLTAAKVISLTALGHRGIQTHVSCPVACRYRVSLQMSSKNARRFGVKGGARKAATLATSSTTPARLGAGSEINVWLKPLVRHGVGPRLLAHAASREVRRLQAGAQRAAPTAPRISRRRCR